jgi:hypothetical protein
VCCCVLGAWLKCFHTRPRGLFTNLRNKGLISVDRRTSLLSYLQYPVQSKSSTKDLSLSMPEMRIDLVLGFRLSLRVNTENG